MPVIHGFPPVVGSHASILILGSMPGEASLAANQYYAHPRNAFWPIMAPLLQIAPNTVYSARIEALKASRIALWDVLKSCERTGSLDTRIEPNTQTINDFRSFFAECRCISHIFFNGNKAENCFRRYVLPGVNCEFATLVRLPSTSPANARLLFEQKCEIWHESIHRALTAGSLACKESL
ncbi:MAG: DNA-deoxyinosine glycosylase [Nitrosomonas sp.]|nr:MAG: DNA-deoxyinosine glycosylase [Nitrosomonas sp.]